MKEYRAEYYLSECYHTYIVDAENEYEAYEKVLRGIPETSRKIMTKLSVERYYRAW